MRRLGPLLLLAAMPLLVALSSLTAPVRAGPVAALFPPWWTAARSYAAAGQSGPVLRFGQLPFIVVVDAADRARLGALGAWLLLDPQALGGCAGVDAHL